MIAEVWQAIPGYEGRYEASNLGGVRSIDRWVRHPKGPMVLRRGRLLNPHLDPDGYQRVTVRPTSDSAAQSRPVHRLVLLAFVGPPGDGEQTCHNDGDRLNNHLSNLRWDTVTENARDRVRHGTHWLAAKTHCKRGHPFDEENTLRPKSGRAKRLCRECARQRRRAARKAAVA